MPVNVKPIVSRGDELLKLGDVAAARLYYERAAILGSGIAAMSLGKTYDPVFLASIRASGVLPDRDRAASWYSKAVGLGDREAETLLARLPGKPASR
jgi:TPR repeat protein